LVRALYAVERKASGFSAEERLRLCQVQLAPVLAGLREKLPVWKE
jgi:hypothetical protein